MLSPLLMAAALLAAEPATTPTLEEILTRVEETDAARNKAMRRFTCMRRYVITNARFNKRAEVIVKSQWIHPGLKEFQVISESGAASLRKRVLYRMMEGEKETAVATRGQSPITRANYDFRLLGSELLNQRLTYILELKPKLEAKYLLRGRAWVDAADYAVIRMEGTFVKNPSFWTREVRTLLEYAKHGEFWLPVRSHSHTDARLFGASDVTIEYYEHSVEPAAATAAQVHAQPTKTSVP
jgi:hypothetical protein